MKVWTTGILLTLTALLPTLAFGQDQWSVPGAPATGYFDPVYCPNPQAGMYDQFAPQAGMYEQLLPARGDQRYCDSRFNLTAREAFAGSYIRLDYMQWQITGGDGTLLGAPVANPSIDLSGNTPGAQLQANDPLTGALPSSTVIVPKLGSAWDTVNGLRGTFGIPTTVGTFEADFFYFQQVENSIRIDPYVNTRIPGTVTTVIGATTLLVNGQEVNNRMILYNESYLAQQTTSLWGTQGNWIYPPFTPNVPVEFSPIIGFRYLSLDDRLRIAGTNVNDTVTLNHVIESIARNNIFGPQIGLRAQSTMGRLELGVETKFIAGINSMTEVVKTQEIFNPTTSTNPDQATEAPRNIRGHRTRFAPIFDLGLSGKLQVNDHFKLYASYQMLLGGGFSRAFDNIDYNSPTSITSAPQIGLDPNLSKFMAHGFAVGGEVVFR